MAPTAAAYIRAVIRPIYCTALLLLACLCRSLPVRAQSPDAPLRFVEQMPSFRGDLAGFLGDNLKYPETARAVGMQGRAGIEFLVETTGYVSREQVVKSSGSAALDSEALRVVRLMERKPYWETARQQGKRVPLTFTLPINFVLDDAAPDSVRAGTVAPLQDLARNLMCIQTEGPERYFLMWSPLQYWSLALRSTGSATVAITRWKPDVLGCSVVYSSRSGMIKVAASNQLREV